MINIDMLPHLLKLIASICMVLQVGLMHNALKKRHIELHELFRQAALVENFVVLKAISDITIEAYDLVTELAHR
jgi:hypothetical protein